MFSRMSSKTAVATKEKASRTWCCCKPVAASERAHGQSCLLGCARNKPVLPARRVSYQPQTFLKKTSRKSKKKRPRHSHRERSYNDIARDCEPTPTVTSRPSPVIILARHPLSRCRTISRKGPISSSHRPFDVPTTTKNHDLSCR